MLESAGIGLLKPAMMDLLDPAVMDFAKPAMMDLAELKLEANKAQSHKLLQELHNLNWKTAQQESIIKSKKNLEINCTHKNEHHFHKQRKPNTIIKPEFQELIGENVIQNGISIAKAKKTFKFSQHQIQ